MTSSASAPVLLREDRGAVSLLTLNVARGNAAWETAELAWVPVSQVQGADRDLHPSFADAWSALHEAILGPRFAESPEN